MAIIDKEKENNLCLEEDEGSLDINDKDILSLFIELFFDFSEAEDYESDLIDTETEEIKA